MEGFPSPSSTFQILQHGTTQPVIFKKRISKEVWKSFPWTCQELLDKYRDKKLSFRIVPKNLKGIAWESASEYVVALLSQFFDWLSGPVQNNPFEQFDPGNVWAYSGYNHMAETFGELDEIVQAVDWSSFGFNEKNGNNSAFWIGSAGSYTPCHYDTYGCNLVAQIQGRKKWILFPPEDSTYMYPTRIPYEESSVFSSVNILSPDFSEHPLFRFSHPHSVILNPGDVLFVPHKWWHFVQSLDISVSVNTWMKLNNDHETHLEESVVRALMTSLISYFEPEGSSWVNTHEELVSPEETLNYINLALGKIDRSGISIEKVTDPAAKSTKTSSKSDVHGKESGSPSESAFQHPDIQPVTPVLFTECFGSDFKLQSTALKNELSAKKIIDCYSHPEVISLICNLLKKC